MERRDIRVAFICLLQDSKKNSHENNWAYWGMSWESTVEYYRIINEAVRERLGDFAKLCQGEIKDSSREQIKAIMKKLINNGVQRIILGCTELALLIKQKDIAQLPKFPLQYRGNTCQSHCGLCL